MGRPQFQQVITQVSERTFKEYHLVDSAPNHNENTEVEIFSSPNTISRVLALELRAQNIPDATAYEHQLFVNSTAGVSFVGGSASGPTTLLISRGQFLNPVNTQYPRNEVSFTQQTQNIYFTENVGLVIQYGNFTDVAQNTERTYDLLVEELQIK